MTTNGRKTGKRLSLASLERAGRMARDVVEATASAMEAAPRKVRFGSVTVDAFGVSRAEALRNIKSGQSALRRAKKAIIQPGVKIEVPKGVPLFHADPDRPDRLVRVIDGKRDYGVFVDGEFKKSLS